MRRRIVTWLVIVFLALLLIGATAYPTIKLGANKSATVICLAEDPEIIVEFYGDNEMVVTCREWVGRGGE